MEDLALSWEDFEALCNEGALKPHARNLAVHPHVRVWTESLATGQIDIEGFLPNRVLRLAGFKLKGAEVSFEGELAQFLRNKFAECHLVVSPPTVLRG